MMENEKKIDFVHIPYANRYGHGQLRTERIRSISQPKKKLYAKNLVFYPTLMLRGAVPSTPYRRYRLSFYIILHGKDSAIFYQNFNCLGQR